LSFDNHGRKMATDAAGFEPVLSPQLEPNRVELREVGRTLDGGAAQAQ